MKILHTILDTNDTDVIYDSYEYCKKIHEL